ncbi:MAG: hypothetical protein CMA59_01175 [Euryarchaeota archaeon]|jgi:hypothetical protein|nr:hypothetical protein [Euryarchaeota archaeon]
MNFKVKPNNVSFGWRPLWPAAAPELEMLSSESTLKYKPNHCSSWLHLWPGAGPELQMLKFLNEL